MSRAEEAQLPPEQDEALVLRLRGGDREAFRAAFHRYKARVYGICLRMTSNGTEAMDLMQEAFLRMYEQIGSLREPARLRSWLDRLTCNVVLLHFRARRRLVLLDEGPEEGGLFDGLPDPREAPPVESFDVERALKRLPEGYRTVFLLYVVHGYSHEEIAGQLGCSVNTSKTQLFKARKRLLQLLAETGCAVELDGKHADGA